MAYEEIFDLAYIFNIPDNTARAVLCHRLAGLGYLIDGIDAYPPYYLSLWDLMEDGRYDEAQSERDRVVVSPVSSTMALQIVAVPRTFKPSMVSDAMPSDKVVSDSLNQVGPSRRRARPSTLD